MDRPAISTGPALMIPAGYPRDLPSALLRAARDFGTAGVVEIGPDGRETRLDFPTLLELAARILAGLRANGVRAGDPAVVHCTEPVGFFAAFWACTLGGIRPLLMSPSPEGDTTEEGRERLRKVTDLLGWTVLIGRPSDLPNDLGLPVLDPDALAGHEPTSEFHRPAADDVAVLMMTSGSSTGTPKIIQLTHRGLVEFAAGTPAMLPVRPGQTTLNWLPLDHSGAFLLYHLLPVFTGCTNIHVATDWVLAEPLRWLDLMDQHRVNHSWSPNFGYRLAAAAIAGEPDRHWDLSALRSLVSGGEQITVPVVSEFLRLTNRFGVVPETFVAAWGMTETVTGITFGRPGLTPNVHRVRISQTGVVEWVDQRTSAGKVAVARPGKGRVDAPGVLSLVSVGAPAPGATVRIVGPNGAVLPEGRIGQLQIASARVTPGYLGNPDADRAAFPAGNWPARKWLATGDQGFITGGQVVITGRDSERIILNGQTYYAHELEAVAATAPGAVAGLVAACGVADAALGTERLLIFYALSSDSAEGVDEAIRSVIRGRLGLDARVVGVPRRHFPTTPGGKILRPLLKQRWLDNTLETAPGPYATPPVASPYGDPIRPGSVPASSRYDDEDASEQTTELPVVRLAWRRNLQDSIPTPPQRPTLGANRHPAPDDLTTTPQADSTEDHLTGTTERPTHTPNQPAGTPDQPTGTANQLTSAADELTSAAGAANQLTGPANQLTGAAANSLEADQSASTADVDPPTGTTDADQPTRMPDSLAGPAPANSTAEPVSTDPLTDDLHATSATASPATQPLADPTDTESPADPEPRTTAADPLTGTAGTDPRPGPTGTDPRPGPTGTDVRPAPTGADLRPGPAGTDALTGTGGNGVRPGATAADVRPGPAGTDALTGGTADPVPPASADLPEQTAADSTADTPTTVAPAGTPHTDAPGATSHTDAPAGTSHADAPAGTSHADSARAELPTEPIDADQPVASTNADASTDASADAAADRSTKTADTPAESADALADDSKASVASTTHAPAASSPASTDASSGEATAPSTSHDAADTADSRDADSVSTDSGDTDSGDAGSGDAGSGDADPRDAGSGDADPRDAGSGDGGSGDVDSGHADSGDVDGVDADVPAVVTSADATGGSTAEAVPATASRPPTVDLDEETTQLPIIRVSKNSADAKPPSTDSDNPEHQAANPTDQQADDSRPADLTKPETDANESAEPSNGQAGDAVSTEVAEAAKAQPADAESADVAEAQAGDGEAAELARSQAVDADAAKAQPADAEPAGAESADVAEAQAGDGEAAEPARSQAVDADAAKSQPADAEPAGAESADVAKAQAADGEAAELARSQAADAELSEVAKRQAGDAGPSEAGKAQVVDAESADVAEDRAGDGESAEPAASQADTGEAAEVAEVRADSARSAELTQSQPGGDAEPAEVAEAQAGDGEVAELIGSQADAAELSEAAKAQAVDAESADVAEVRAENNRSAELTPSRPGNSAESAEAAKAQAGDGESAGPAASQADVAESAEVAKAHGGDGEAAELSGSQAEDVDEAGVAEVRAEDGGSLELAGVAEVGADGGEPDEVAEARAGGGVAVEATEAQAGDPGSVELAGSPADGVGAAEGAEVRPGDGEPVEVAAAQADGGEAAEVAEVRAWDGESAEGAEVRQGEGEPVEVAAARADGGGAAEVAELGGAVGVGQLETGGESAEVQAGDVEAAEGQPGGAAGAGGLTGEAQADGVPGDGGVASPGVDEAGAARAVAGVGGERSAEVAGASAEELVAGAYVRMVPAVGKAVAEDGAGTEVVAATPEELVASDYVRMMPGAVARDAAGAKAVESAPAGVTESAPAEVAEPAPAEGAEPAPAEGAAAASAVALGGSDGDAEVPGQEAAGAEGSEVLVAEAGRVEAGAEPAEAGLAVAAVRAPAKGGERARKDGKAAVRAGVVEPVAVVGLAGRFPGASSVDEFWENLLGGVESVRRFSEEELKEAGGTDAFGDEELVAVSGALDDVELFDAAFFGLSDREAELTDPAQRLFLEVCQQALENGGYAGASGRIGIFAGSGMNLYTQQNQPPDYLATRVAYRLGLTGPAIGVQAAWSSSLVAVHLACQALRSGDADLALAGAAAVHVPQATGYHASARSILSPTGHVRAFDEKADGTVGGNGVAAVLLKRLDQAVADGDTVYAVIKGSAVTNDGGQAGQVELVERALEKSGVPAASLSYVEANATGTAEDDTVEFRALTAALRKHTDQVGFVTIGSVKPNIGHLDSAAGMAGLIKTVLMLQHRTLVPTINYSKPNPDLSVANSPFVVGTEVRDWEAGTPLRAGVSALDAKGTSAHVILEEAPRQIRRGEDGPVVLPISAPDPAALADLAVLFRTELEEGTGQRLIDLAGTASIGRPAHRHRIAVAGSSESELAEALATAATAEVPRGGPGPLGFAFTGQGAARRGMAAGLATRFPVFRAVLDECDKVYEEEVGGRLLELLLTPAGTDDGVWPTETAQPALFAFELALARLWQSFGVQPALVVGHSVGEYAALCVAGALSLADGVKLTAQRGVLMQRGTVPGAMVAVRADADRVRELAQTPGVEIAAGNGPQNFVLTGSEVIVGQLAEQLDRLELKWQRLDVDRAFHSSLVEPILADFAKVVAEIKLKPLRMPMVSSWSGELLESGTALDGDYLVGQLRQPVLFGDAVEALTAAGCRRFLELGPDAVLSPAGRRIAPNSTWIPAQRLGQDPVLATMNGLAELYEQGTEIAWAKVYPESGRVPLPTYPFRRVHHPVDASARPVASAQPAVVEDERSIERSGAALKRIPLDPPASNGVVVPTIEEVDLSPFAIPAEDDPDRLSTQPIEVTEPLPVVELDGAELVASAYVQMVPAKVVSSAGAEPAVAEAEVPEERSRPVASAADLYRDSLEAVLDLTGEQLGLDPYDLTVDHTFAELGADSLSMLRVVEEVGQRFDVEIAVSELFDDLNTPHKLAAAVASRNQPDGDEVDPLDLLRQTEPAADAPAAENADPRTALAVLGSGLAELAAKVDAAAAATSEAELPGSGMAALMSQQLRVAGQLVDGVTKLMHEQLALLNDTAQRHEAAQEHEAAQQRGAGQQHGAGEQLSDATQSAATSGVPEKDSKKAQLAKAEAEKAKRARDLEYWQTALEGAQPLVLPTDRPRPAGDDVIGTVTHELNSEIGDAVFAFSRDRRVSPLMTMLAAVGTVLGRFADQDDLVIGTAALRRPGDTTRQPALPLRLDLTGEPDLGDLAQRVREITTTAVDHSTADLATLEQDPLFQVLVEFEAGEEELAQSLDLRFRLAYHGGGITCTADYRAGLFDHQTIKRLLAYLEAVLRRAIEDPRLPLPDLMLPIDEDKKILAEFEGEAPQTGPVGRLRRDAVVAGELSGLHTLFEQQVARTPDAIALIQGDREISYAELDRRSNAVAWQLVDLGVKPGQLVAVRVARGAELVVAVLAVLKSGAAYLPLDPGVPESRWSFMTADAGAVALVGDDAALADRLGLRLVPVAAVDGDTRSKQAPPVRAAADDIAYCIYTSGSTGNPKGVAVPHRGPVNLIRHYLRTRRSLRTLQWTSFGFDVHVQEMFTALASGAALVLIGEDDRYDPDAVIAALKDHGVERLFMAFTPLTALLATMRKVPELPALREIVAGSEAMVVTHKIRDFLEAHPECTLYNEYGPTEASVVTTIHQVDPDEDRPSIGRPIDGVVVRLLDEALRPVPVGAIGEIHLGGVAVAQGYLGRPEETETAFVSDPAHPGGRLYRSRDLGRWRADGSLDYLGRADDQVKIRGHRVEPGETEHVLADLPGVIDAVVVACADPAGDTCLIGYVVLEDSDPAVLANLLLELTKELPIYLVPADLIPVEDLPLDSSGKLDRSRLPEPEWLKGN
ncbi:non-ribosomal peptide synthetase/type I polyketide synthase [Kribbella ginsengisoli]|uniref:Amino acid adenylation domain-containing protein n=1 Tax=Kribbella ginsengisoli TaxID=363865 RepID=A0ABP6Z7X6_9ACTN